MRNSHRTNSSLLRGGATLAVMLAVPAGLVACGEPATRSTSRFCGELTEHATEMQTPPSEPGEIPALITLYSKMGEVAPLEIEGDWETVYGVLKTANTVNSADPASQQKAVDAAYAATQAAVNVSAWAKANCNLDIGPVPIVPGGADIETTTTTVPAPAG